VVEVLDDIRSLSKTTRPDDLVFTSTGIKPVDEKNITHRALKPAGKELGIPWVSWHVFRHSHATFIEDVGMPFSDRQAQMGHSAGNMTLHYTHSDLERRRGAVEIIAGKLTAAAVNLAKAVRI
jgi:integrase